MRLGISSFTYPWAVGRPGYAPSFLPEQPMTAIALVQRAAGLGVSVLQVCDNLPLHGLAPSELDAFARRAREAKVDIEVGTRGMENVPAYLELAGRLGSPIVRLVVDSADWQPTEEELVAELRRQLPECHRLGVSIAIENHGRHTATELVAILEAVGDAHVGMCLDVANSFGALEGPKVVVETLAAYAINLHIKDFVVRRLSHSLGYIIEGCAPGEGRLDAPWLVEQLVRAGKDRADRPLSVILEQWTPPEPTLEATLAKEAAWADKGVAYLKQVLAVHDPRR
jgi:3-oxoisoapionate decarboxylase